MFLSWDYSCFIFCYVFFFGSVALGIFFMLREYYKILIYVISVPSGRFTWISVVVLCIFCWRMGSLKKFLNLSQLFIYVQNKRKKMENLIVLIITHKTSPPVFFCFLPTLPSCIQLFSSLLLFYLILCSEYFIGYCLWCIISWDMN